MKTVKEIMGKAYEKFVAPHKQWQQMDFIEHGMGMMRVEEHSDMVRQGVIKCSGEIDEIIADYPKLVVKKGSEDVTIDMSGNIAAMNLEIKEIQKSGGNAHIEYFPRKWTQYMANKRAKENARGMENQANESLINIAEDFGGVITN